MGVKKVREIPLLQKGDLGGVFLRITGLFLRLSKQLGKELLGIGWEGGGNWHYYLGHYPGCYPGAPKSPSDYPGPQHR